MKIYYYAPPTTSPEREERYKDIRAILERAGMEVLTRETKAADAFPETYQQLEQRGQSLLDYVSAIVIEGTVPDPEVGYLLAYAIAQKRPTLLLVEKGHKDATPLKTFGAQRLPSTLVSESYHRAKLEQIVLQFLQGLGDIEYLEVPSIKFTLRVTPAIEQYLHWKTHNTDLSKADFLRKLLLEEIIARDEAYQRFRKRRTRPYAGA